MVTPCCRTARLPAAGTLRANGRCHSPSSALASSWQEDLCNPRHGHIGQCVARRACTSTWPYCDPRHHAPDTHGLAFGGRRSTRSQRADYPAITNHPPNGAVLDEAHAVLINVARAEIVDEAAPIGPARADDCRGCARRVVPIPGPRPPSPRAMHSRSCPTCS